MKSAWRLLVATLAAGSLALDTVRRRTASASLSATAFSSNARGGARGTSSWRESWRAVFTATAAASSATSATIADRTRLSMGAYGDPGLRRDDRLAAVS